MRNYFKQIWSYVFGINKSSYHFPRFNIKLYDKLDENEIEYLLGRKILPLDTSHYKCELEHKTIMITGAAGTIGSGLVKILKDFNLKNLILIDNSESSLYSLQEDLNNLNVTVFASVVADIRDLGRMERIFQEFKPDVVFHAAAYKHVPLMEKYPYEAVGVNIVGTKIIADLSNKHGVEKFILISTDKAVNPSNVMGATKRIAELYMLVKNTFSKTNFITTRFSNIIESNGSVIPVFKEQIKTGGPIYVTHPQMERYFMTTSEACNFILHSSSLDQNGETFLFKIGEGIKIQNLATKLLKILKIDAKNEIEIINSGIRPGEKLKEEFIGHFEKLVPTYFENISIAQNKKPMDLKKIEMQIINLCETYKSYQNIAIVNQLKEIVPEYRSNNSSYEVLDRNSSNSRS